MRSVSGLVAVLVALVLPAASLAATSVANGSFEKDASIGSFQTLPTGSTAIDGWTVTAGTVDWIGTYWAHADGAKSLDMNGLAPGAIVQDFPTKAANTYVVSFYLAGNPTCGSTTKTLAVSATGGPTASYTFDASGRTRTNMGWTLQTYSFVASATSTDAKLTFSSTTTGTCGPALDLVSVTETEPEPAPDPEPVLTAADCKKNGWRSMNDSAGNSFRNQGDCVSYYATGGRNRAASKP